MNIYDACTFFMVPFYYDHEIDLTTLIDSADSIWEKAIMDVETDILYPYIQDFLQATIIKERINRNSNNNGPQIHIPIYKHFFHIYSIKDKALEDQSKVKSDLAYWKKFVNRQSSVTITTQGSDSNISKPIQFRFLNQTSEWMSPKIILCPNAGVGLLSFCIKLTIPNPTTNDLMAFNYTMHKVDAQAAPCELDFEMKSNLADNILALKSAELEAIISLFNQKKNSKEWKITEVLDFLLRPISNYIVLFNKKRMHLFTYYQLNEAEMSIKAKEDFIRIVRGENHHYLLGDNEFEHSDLSMKTFQNIFMGASVEGGAILTLLPPTKSVFFKTFVTASLSKRYLWIYLMVLMQRHTQLSVIRRLTEIDDADAGLSLDKLQKLERDLSMVKVNTYFSDVSDYTQHNQFYQFCCHNLKIKQQFDEIDNKMHILQTVIKQKVDSDQRRIADAQEKMAKEQTRIAEEQKKAAARFEKKQNKINLIIALIVASLAILSTSNDGIDFLVKVKFVDKDSTCYVEVAKYLFIISGLIIIIPTLIIWFKKDKK